MSSAENPPSRIAADAPQPPPPNWSAPRGGLRLGMRQMGALLRRSWLLKARAALRRHRPRVNQTLTRRHPQARGWRQTLAEFATPTLLMAALVIGSRLAEVTTSEQVRRPAPAPTLRPVAPVAR